MLPLFAADHTYREQYGLIAGIDEAGRGPLAGPVVVAGVILHPDYANERLNDSKKLNKKTREVLFDEILAHALAHHIEIIEPSVIDEINILNASLTGMRLCAEALLPRFCLVDGNKVPVGMPVPTQAVVRGDGIHACIAAASILAKVTRDRIMEQMDTVYPGYGFARHMGYPTPQHLEAIQRLGITPIHRRTYAPVQQILISFL